MRVLRQAQHERNPKGERFWLAGRVAGFCARVYYRSALKLHTMGAFRYCGAHYCEKNAPGVLEAKSGR